MSESLKITAYKAGELISKYCFSVPPFQREYSWKAGEIRDFWKDLMSGIERDEYYTFMGLIIIAENRDEMDASNSVNLIDGQQRLVTIILLAKVLHEMAIKLERNALADLIESTFIFFNDGKSNHPNIRISFSDYEDNNMFREIIQNGYNDDLAQPNESKGIYSSRMKEAYNELSKNIDNYMNTDDNKFKLIGDLTYYIKDRLHFGIFLQSDEASAHRLFEAINTRGLALTKADLIKNYILSSTCDKEKDKVYRKWQEISKSFSPNSPNKLVQYIKHALSLEFGHIPANDLYDFLSGNRVMKKSPPSSSKLLEILLSRLKVYLQMDNPGIPGPVTNARVISVFEAFNSLEIVSVRPILLALHELDDENQSVNGMEELLRLVVRRMVVGNIGTGKVESDFGEVAKAILDTNSWDCLYRDLTDFDYKKDHFLHRLSERSFNKKTLRFIRQSALQKTITPMNDGYLHWIWPRRENWKNLTKKNAGMATTLGNSILANRVSRARNSSADWNSFKENFLGFAVDEEIVDELDSCEEWNMDAISNMGKMVAEVSADVWYTP